MPIQQKISILLSVVLLVACSDDLASGDNGQSETDTGNTASITASDSDGTKETDTASFDTASDNNEIRPGGDLDSDGWFAPFDCNEFNPHINPAAAEIPDDKIDNDCDDEVDEQEGTGPAPTDQVAELWYSSDNLLVHIDINPDDGTVSQITASELTGMKRGQNAITVLDDGTLLLARLAKADMQTYFYHIPTPKRDGTPTDAQFIGVMPQGIMLEALYTDCDGRIYGMDTGVDDGSADGNRLIRFTGDLLNGQFDFKVISDLASAQVADIDDMSPGIDATGQVTDNPGFAIDTSDIYDFNYETGTGTLTGSGGTWGVHVLGAPLFTDHISRLYLLSSSAEIFEMDPFTGTVSDPLGQGPAVATAGDRPGWSGLAGPLTNCQTGFTIN